MKAERPEARRARGSGRNEDPHREATRGVGPVTGTAGSESRSGRGGRHRSHLEPRASWCSYHREALTHSSASIAGPGFAQSRSREAGTRSTGRLAGGGRGTEGPLVLIPPGDSHNSDRPPACRWEIGAELERRSAPRLGRGVGPVTGSAGSERRCGRGGRHHFRLKAEGLLMLIPSRGPHLFTAALLHRAGPRPDRGNGAARDAHTVHVSDTPADTREARRPRPARRGRRRDARRWRWRRTPGPRGCRPTRSCRAHGRCSSTVSPTWTRWRRCWPVDPTTWRVEPGPLVEVPVTYDGADLDDVAARWGTDVDGVVAGSPGSSSSRRSAASRRGSPT